PMSKKLEGKVAVITGGNSGIGLATAKQFVNEGAYVFITGRRERGWAAGVKEIGRNIPAVRHAVSRLEDLNRLFAQIKREKARLDIVFANAGIWKYAPPGHDHRGALRFDLRRQREGPAVHGAEGAAAAARRCLDHPECLHRRQQGVAGEKRLRRHKSRRALFRADMDNGSQGPSYARERGKPGRHLHARTG